MIMILLSFIWSGSSSTFPRQSSEDQTGTIPPEDSDTTGDTDTGNSSDGNRQMPISRPSFNMNNMAASPSDFSGWIWIAISVVILAIGLIVAKKYKG